MGYALSPYRPRQAASTCGQDLWVKTSSERWQQPWYVTRDPLNDLPHLPVPILSSTSHKYLETLLPLLSPTQHAIR